MILLFCILCGFQGQVNAAGTGENTSDENTESHREVIVNDKEDFLRLAQQCRLDSYSKNLRVNLETDIDLSDTDFDGFPIFCGEFQGNGHKITGWTLKSDGSVRGLFRYLTQEASVCDLRVEGKIVPGGSRGTIGAIAGNNAGYIGNCQFEGEVSGAESAGGLAGINTLTGVIENCIVSGNVSGDHFVGGIAGNNYGVIRNCDNHAGINVTVRQNTVEISDITLDTLTDSEAVNTTTDIGGIAGFNNGVIRSCRNTADVGYRHIGYNVGGIAGSQMGYITECVNYGEVFGRKEVGGIAGQMEPAVSVNFEKDTLQILDGQLIRMEELSEKTLNDTKEDVGEFSKQVESVQDETKEARKALELLNGEAAPEKMTDPDSIQAARNYLSSRLTGMEQKTGEAGKAARESGETLSENLQNMQEQMLAILSTADQASEYVGVEINDVSDADTVSELTGKVEGCRNFARVQGDLSVGGIVGAIAPENDLDADDDVEITGNTSMNVQGRLRAVVLACENKETVTIKHSYVGGIVGFQSMGLVKQCVNTGDIQAKDAEYAGGIVGYSEGYVRENAARCVILAGSSAGGIAGSAMIASDNLSMVSMEGMTEKAGAILGTVQDDIHEEKVPVSNNLYLTTGVDRGGIDGISYEGIAMPLETQDFLELEGLPECFGNVTVSFVYGDGKEKKVTLDTGDSLSRAKIPEVPEYEGSMGEWKGMEEADLDNIMFDMTFYAEYSGQHTVLESSTLSENGMPVLLLQGMFSEDTKLSVSDVVTGELPKLEESEEIMDAVSIQLSGSGTVTGARYRTDEDMNTEQLKLYVRSKDGSWRRQYFTEDGSYMVFDATSDDLAFVLALQRKNNRLLIGAGVGLTVLVTAVILMMRRRKKHRSGFDTAAV